MFSAVLAQDPAQLDYQQHSLSTHARIHTAALGTAVIDAHLAVSMTLAISCMRGRNRSWMSHTNRMLRAWSNGRSGGDTQRF